MKAMHGNFCLSLLLIVAPVYQAIAQEDSASSRAYPLAPMSSDPTQDAKLRKQAVELYEAYLKSQQDPARLAQQAEDQVSRVYRPLLVELQLTAEQEKAVLEVVRERSIGINRANYDLRKEGRITRAEREKIVDEFTRAAETKIRPLVNETQYAFIRQCLMLEQELLVVSVSEAERLRKSGNPLTSKQVMALAEARHKVLNLAINQRAIHRYSYPLNAEGLTEIDELYIKELQPLLTAEQLSVLKASFRDDQEKMNSTRRSLPGVKDPSAKTSSATSIGASSQQNAQSADTTGKYVDTDADGLKQQHDPEFVAARLHSYVERCFSPLLGLLKLSPDINGKVVDSILSCEIEKTIARNAIRHLRNPRWSDELRRAEEKIDERRTSELKALLSEPQYSFVDELIRLQPDIIYAVNIEAEQCAKGGVPISVEQTLGIARARNKFLNPENNPNVRNKPMLPTDKDWLTEIDRSYFAELGAVLRKDQLELLRKYMGERQRKYVEALKRGD